MAHRDTHNRSRPAKRQYRVPAAGWTYIAVVSLVGIGSINSQNNLLFFLFGLALGAILVSGIISGSMMMGVRVERLRVDDARVGEPARIRYRVHNANRFVPIFAVSITEKSLAPKGSGRSAASFLPHDEPPPRLFGLFASRLPPKVPRPHAMLAFLRAGESADVVTTLRPLRRGRVKLSRIRVTTTFPLGIVEKTVVFVQPDSFVVEPRVDALTPADIRAATDDPAPSAHASKRRGLGLEFFALREYVPGDSPRFVSWRASARHGTLLTKETEADADHAMMIDLRLPAGDDALDPDTLTARDPLIAPPAPVEHAIARAASLAAGGTRMGRRVGLRCDAAGVLVPPHGNPRQLAAILNELALLDATNGPPAPPARAERDAAVLVVDASKATPIDADPNASNA